MSASLRPTRHLALLRAVNLGGRNKVPMADLRALAEELGYQDVATHIASGNLFFSSPKGRDALERELTPALADRFDFAIDVVIVGRDTVAKAAEAHPFADGDPKIVHVCFCDRRVPKATLDRLLALAGPGERVAAEGDLLYLDYGPGGLHRSKVGGRLAALLKPGFGTARNLQTVRALLALMDSRG